MQGKTIPQVPKKDNKFSPDPASFRDRKGFVFIEEGRILRQVNTGGKESYDRLLSSGLYDELTKRKWLVKHEELDRDLPRGAYRIIRPQEIPFISYPYEWSFSQLKEAALLTLKLEELALEKGLSLVDASAYNIQLLSGKPVMIDTLSFEPYQEGKPWGAYRQFCQHFLAPLALVSYVDLDLGKLLANFIDGVPLPLTHDLLPLKARLRFGLAIHLGLHASMQRKKSDAAKKQTGTVTMPALKGIVASLRRTVESLPLPASNTVWSDYYSKTNYSDEALEAKAKIVKQMTEALKPKRILDLGSNNGWFSRAAEEISGALVISADVDPAAVEDNYKTMRERQEENILPLVVDLTNPSPALGWANRERSSFGERAKADMVLALALVHHLAIANNVPLRMIAEYFAGLAPGLVIEFVPKSDSQTQKLLANREDIFEDYHEQGFEAAFGSYYAISSKQKIAGTERTIYLMRRGEYGG